MTESELPTSTPETKHFVANPKFRESWQLAGSEISNRIVLAPLAGIGNWFVRLQAKRYGAGLVVSEMVSSHGLAYGDRRTFSEFLKIHPEEHPVSVQLFGADPAIMKEAAAIVAESGADFIDLNMGCPVRKVYKTGAGSAMLAEPDLAVAVAKAAHEGSGLPVTVKLRPGVKPGERTGVDLAHRLAAEAGIAAISFHPRHASQQHKGLPDYELAREVTESLPIPLVLSGGMMSNDKVAEVLDQTGCAAIMLARGALGNPWFFSQVLGEREGNPTVEEVLDEVNWVIDGAIEHWGEERAINNLKKFYPWYLDTLREVDPERFTRAAVAPLTDALQRTSAIEQAREVFAGLRLAAV